MMCCVWQIGLHLNDTFFSSAAVRQADISLRAKATRTGNLSRYLFDLFTGHLKRKNTHSIFGVAKLMVTRAANQ